MIEEYDERADPVKQFEGELDAALRRAPGVSVPPNFRQRLMTRAKVATAGMFGVSRAISGSSGVNGAATRTRRLVRAAVHGSDRPRSRDCNCRVLALADVVSR